MAPVPLLTKLVLEVRYADGELYWDLSGRVRRSLRLQNPKWDFSATPENAFWQCRLPLEAGGDLAFLHCNFGALKFDFSYEPSAWTKTTHAPLAAIQAHIEQFSQIILDGLSVERCTRIGLRLWQLLPSDSRKAAEALMLATSYCRPRADPPPELGTPVGVDVIDRYEHEGAEARIALEAASIMLHTTGEQRHGVVLDIDYRKQMSGEPLDARSHLTKGLSYVTASTTALSHELFDKDKV